MSDDGMFTGNTNPVCEWCGYYHHEIVECSRGGMRRTIERLRKERDEARETARTFFKLVTKSTGSGSMVIGDAAVFTKWPWLENST